MSEEACGTRSACVFDLVLQKDANARDDWKGIFKLMFWISFVSYFSLTGDSSIGLSLHLKRGNAHKHRECAAAKQTEARGERLPSLTFVEDSQ